MFPTLRRIEYAPKKRLRAEQQDMISLIQCVRQRWTLHWKFTWCKKRRVLPAARRTNGLGCLAAFFMVAAVKKPLNLIKSFPRVGAERKDSFSPSKMKRNRGYKRFNAKSSLKIRCSPDDVKFFQIWSIDFTVALLGIFDYYLMSQISWFLYYKRTAKREKF